jgi:hypothetical protein
MLCISCFKIVRRSWKQRQSLGQHTIKTLLTLARFLSKVNQVSNIQISDEPALISNPKAHDFFQPQPVKDAAVFFMRMIVHNWPDSHVRTMLRHLRDAATTETKLLVIDYILPYACKASQDYGIEDADIVIEGEPAAPPYPLLPNMGEAGKYAHLMDICVSHSICPLELRAMSDTEGSVCQMRAMLNAQERTLQEHVQLYGSAGWKVIRVVQTESRFGYITAVPI